MARIYLTLGYQPTPVAPGAKNPIRVGWQKTRVTDSDLGQFEGNNVGLLCGEPSGGIVDVDLDCSEALALADAFLPSTTMIHGRPGASRSHRWYRDASIQRTVQFRHVNGSMSVELRSTGGQTVVPPSVADGEERTWAGGSTPGSPSQPAPGVLLESARRLAAACLLTRNYPAPGARHEFALALAGTLLRLGGKVEDVEHFIGMVATTANDEEATDRVACVHTTVRRIRREPARNWTS